MGLKLFHLRWLDGVSIRAAYQHICTAEKQDRVQSPFEHRHLIRCSIGIDIVCGNRNDMFETSRGAHEYVMVSCIVFLSFPSI